MKVLISVAERSYVTEPADPDDEWDRDNTRTEIAGVSATLVENDYKAYSFYGHNPVPLDVKNGDLVYTVIVRYSSGDTFGNDDGQVAVMDTFKSLEKARVLRDWLAAYDSPDYSGWNPKKAVPYSAEFKGKEYNIPWFGYFEHLEGLEIHEVTVGHDDIVRW